jgi:hypothetical protein
MLTVDDLIDIFLKLLLTSIFPLADIAKIPVNILFSKDDCLSRKTLHSQQERLYPVIFEIFIFRESLQCQQVWK